MDSTDPPQDLLNLILDVFAGITLEILPETIRNTLFIVTTLPMLSSNIKY